MADDPASGWAPSINTTADSPANSLLLADTQRCSNAGTVTAEGETSLESTPNALSQNLPIPIFCPSVVGAFYGEFSGEIDVLIPVYRQFTC